MSLARIRDEFRIPARPGARVTVQTPFTPPVDGTITGSLDDWVIVRRDDGGLVRAYPHELTFPKRTSPVSCRCEFGWQPECPHHGTDTP